MSFWNQGAPDAAAIGPYHSDGDPNPEITTCPIVESTPLVSEAYGQVLQRGLLLSDQQTVDWDYERVKVVPLLETRVEILKLSPFPPRQGFSI